MTSLEEAAAERIVEFKANVRAFKKREQMTNKELAELCEIGPDLIQMMLSHESRGMMIKTALKISMATGIQL